MSVCNFKCGVSKLYADLKESGVRGSMYNREFVSTILELVGSNCPEVSCSSQYMDM